MQRVDESRIKYWLVAGAGVHVLAFCGTALWGGRHEANHDQRFANGAGSRSITEIEIWESLPQVNSPAVGLQLVPTPEPIERPPSTTPGARDARLDIANVAETIAPADEFVGLAPGPATTPSVAPPRKPLDFGITHTSYLVVGAELGGASKHDRYRDAERKLNLDLSRAALESDSLTRQSLDSAARRLLLDVARALPLKGKRIVVRFTLTNGGTIDSVAVPTSEGLEATFVSALTASLESRSVALRPPRPIEYTFELTDSTRTATGRTAGTRLSLGGFDVGESAADSPQVNILPRKWKFERGRNLSRNGDGRFEEDPESSVYVEQRVFETSVDPTDILGGTRRELRARLIRSRVL